MLIAGCQVFYALKTDVMHFNRYIAMAADGEQPCRVYNADCAAEPIKQAEPAAKMYSTVEITKAEFGNIQQARCESVTLGDPYKDAAVLREANKILARRGIKGAAVGVFIRSPGRYTIDVEVG